MLWFQKLQPESLEEITRQMLLGLQQRLSQLEISMEFTPEAVHLLANAPKTAQYGARPMKSYLAQSVENPIANKLLLQELSAGDEIQLTAKEENFIVLDHAIIK
ncbi:MAG: hypothetical protein LIO74_05330 [Ruminococcus sp.]|nr:hypothetical protein [Ruminococcus sp.]